MRDREHAKVTSTSDPSGFDSSGTGSSESDRSSSGEGQPGGPSGFDSNGSNSNVSGWNDWRPVYLRPSDQRELERVVRTYRRFKSPSHVLRIYLKGELLPRFEKGDYSSEKLAREVALRSAPSRAREDALIGLKCWSRLEKAAHLANARLRHLERKVSWHGSLQGLPFTRFRPKMIVRAAAREIAKMTPEETTDLFSQVPDRVPDPTENPDLTENPTPTEDPIPSSGREPTPKQPPPKQPPPKQPSPKRSPLRQSPSKQYQVDQTRGQHRPEGAKEEEFEKRASGERRSGEEKSGEGSCDARYQLLSKPPGHERGGKAVSLSITAEAASRLQQKVRQKSWEYRSSLVRRAIREVLRWIGEDPVEALRYIREDSPLYKLPLEQGYDGYAVLIEPATKRRLKQARRALQDGPGRELGRRITQREILQAAARWALERCTERESSGRESSGPISPPQ